MLVMMKPGCCCSRTHAALTPRTQHWLAQLIVKLNAAAKIIERAPYDLDAWT
jgi:hypothetical protein